MGLVSPGMPMPYKNRNARRAATAEYLKQRLAADPDYLNRLQRERRARSVKQYSICPDCKKLSLPEHQCVFRPYSAACARCRGEYTVYPARTLTKVCERCKALETLQVAQPSAEWWPYGATGFPVEEVNAFVPKIIPESLRADICQELVVEILYRGGQVSNLETAYRRIRTQVYGPYTISLDSPLMSYDNSHESSKTLADFIPDPESIGWEDTLLDSA